MRGSLEMNDRGLMPAKRVPRMRLRHTALRITPVRARRTDAHEQVPRCRPQALSVPARTARGDPGGNAVSSGPRSKPVALH